MRPSGPRTSTGSRSSRQRVRLSEPLAELASAEASFTVGDYSSALNFAERARRSLPRNTVAYRRADDIVNFAGNEVRERMQRTAGRRS